MKNSAGRRHVLITGASTGIGEACALELASRGWHVFAGVRKKEDGDALAAKAGARVTPIMLDVTCRDHVAAAVERVRDAVEAGGLQGLVNNAGIAVAGPLEFMPLAEFERMFAVNVLGVVAVTQAFLPLVRAARGRIVIIGSNSGFWCEPFLAAYGATKFALEGIADSLRTELRPWGIEVVLVEPGMIRTPIWEKSRQATEQLHANMPPEYEALYAHTMEAVRQAAEKGSKLAIPPERIARAVRRALEARRPKTRYPVGPDARIQSILARWTSDRLRDRITRWAMKI